MNAIRLRVLALLVFASLGIAVLTSYLIVVSQNPHSATATQPLYGPSDYIPP